MYDEIINEGYKGVRQSNAIENPKYNLIMKVAQQFVITPATAPAMSLRAPRDPPIPQFDQAPVPIPDLQKP
ncbi:hypothetical protein GJ744_012337 [Endocarpon pusillum]|uniref:Uncharacterized protein n=1 Tax=Endocarpon pusillum TaxID=364733 RepID=A0A8H7E253_9EURO|nr:hypothetical protein GJ744_012337 [Endocarpon pusillum]